MKHAIQTDRRQAARFPQSLEIKIQPLPQLGSSRTLRAGAITGRIQNVSEGGICLITSRPIEKFSLLRCEIAIGDVPLHISTLMQVRWTRKQNMQPESYLSGLEFLL
ncbi:PilZ domain-containing protein [Paracidobacterium acidisoli]|uniref:PilZ domain-containing protein n=1 Tax=Paracidobacterium acidisoli TaxID=2303751 RepID=A0A372ITA2_9BACT|nr:PilZ domain-containing protein [Paracidobacterium acidisoli]